MSNYIDIVFDGPPSHESGRFVEVENYKGESINSGKWIQRLDGYWVLRIFDLPYTEELVVIPPEGTRLYFQYSSPPIDVPPDPAWNDARRMKRGVMISEYSMRLKNASKALADKLKLINEDPQFKSVWFFMANHGCNYTGPDYGKELKDLEKVLDEQ